MTKMDSVMLIMLMNSAIYRKTMENSRNRIDVKLVNNEKDYLKFTARQSYMLNKIFYNKLVVIHKSKLALTLNKPAYIGYIKNKYGNKSKLLFTNTNYSMYEIKTVDVYEDFSRNNEMFDFINYSTKCKYCHIQTNQ